MPTLIVSSQPPKFGLSRRIKSGLLEEFQATSGVKPYALNILNDVDESEITVQ